MYGIEKETECCYNCEHFVRHYHYDRTLIYRGHCRYPRIKERAITDVCEKFKRMEEKEKPRQTGT